MSKHVRLRCPICGMLSWQSRLQKRWEFEVVIQETHSAGKGKGYYNKYSAPEDAEGVWRLKLALIKKMEVVIEELREEARAERDVEWRGLLHKNEHIKALELPRVADFESSVPVVVDYGVEVTFVPLIVETNDRKETFFMPAGKGETYKVGTVREVLEEAVLEETEMELTADTHGEKAKMPLKLTHIGKARKLLDEYKLSLEVEKDEKTEYFGRITKIETSEEKW